MTALTAIGSHVKKAVLRSQRPRDSLRTPSTPHSYATDAPRVCVVGSSFHYMSGISTHTCMLTNALAEDGPTSALLMRKLLPRRLYPGKSRVGESLTLLRYRDDVPVYDGVDFYWIPSIIGAVRFLRRNRPEVVVFQWWSGTVLHSFLLLGLISRLIGARIIVEFHEVLDTAEAAHPMAARYARLLSRPFLGLSQAAAVHSSVDKDLVALSYPSVGDRPIAVVPLGSHDIANRSIRSMQAERAPERTFNLLFFGTIRPYKGLENLIRAFDSLPPEEAARFRLTVVGETWEGWTLPAELIAASPYRDRIDFVNRYVTDEEAAGYFDAANGVVLPYLRSSASGPLHITMTHGLPVAVSAVGGLIEAASEYTGARLVVPGDVADLAAAVTELPSMRGPHADPHSWNVSARRLATLFR